MSCILHIETSTNVCSVALTQDGTCLLDQTDTKGPNHASVLAPFVEEAVSFADSHAIPLDAVALSMGPGSYTGLRIGTSTAKGLCYSRQIPLVAIPTLQTLCVPVLLYHEEVPEDALLCPMIDARRMEVYAALYERSLQTVEETSAIVVEAHTFDKWLDKRPVVFFGNGAEKCQEVIRHPNAHFIADIVPLAQHMMPLAEKKMALGQTEDVAYFEPFYLKDFVAGKPKPLF